MKTKKIFASILIICLTLSLSACTTSNSEKQANYDPSEAEIEAELNEIAQVSQNSSNDNLMASSLDNKLIQQPAPNPPVVLSDNSLVLKKGWNKVNLNQYEDFFIGKTLTKTLSDLSNYSDKIHIIVSNDFYYSKKYKLKTRKLDPDYKINLNDKLYIYSKDNLTILLPETDLWKKDGKDIFYGDGDAYITNGKLILSGENGGIKIDSLKIKEEGDARIYETTSDNLIGNTIRFACINYDGEIVASEVPCEDFIEDLKDDNTLSITPATATIASGSSSTFTRGGSETGAGTWSLSGHTGICTLLNTTLTDSDGSSSGGSSSSSSSGGSSSDINPNPPIITSNTATVSCNNTTGADATNTLTLTVGSKKATATIIASKAVATNLSITPATATIASGSSATFTTTGGQEVWGAIWTLSGNTDICTLENSAGGGASGGGGNSATYTSVTTVTCTNNTSADATVTLNLAVGDKKATATIIASKADTSNNTPKVTAAKATNNPTNLSPFSTSYEQETMKFTLKPFSIRTVYLKKLFPTITLTGNVTVGANQVLVYSGSTLLSQCVNSRILGSASVMADCLIGDTNADGIIDTTIDTISAAGETYTVKVVANGVSYNDTITTSFVINTGDDDIVWQDFEGNDHNWIDLGSDTSTTVIENTIKN